jgi:hypothetical protein
MPDPRTDDARDQEFLRQLILAWRATLEPGRSHPSLDQVINTVTRAAEKSGLVPNRNADTASPPTPEDIRRWEVEANTFFDDLRREFPDTYRDPAFRAAVQARVPELVNRLMKGAR